MFRRVLIFRSALLAASETFILAQATALQRYEPYFVGMRRVEGLATPVDATLVLNDGSIIGRLREKFFANSRMPHGFLSRLKKLRPSVIHAHFAVDACVALPIVRALGIPLIVTMHGYDVTVSDQVFRQHKDRAHRDYPSRRSDLFKEGHHFIAVSDFIRKTAVELGFPHDRTTTHYIGIDEVLFEPSMKRAGEKSVVFVGRLVEKKGCAHLINAMAKVQLSAPEATLVVVGDGPLRTQLEMQAAQELRNYKFVGAQSVNAVRSYLGGASVFCAPSVAASTGDSEGLGMVFLEAQAMGVPVVSFASGGIPEAVDNERTGLLVQPGDDAGLADSIVRLLRDADLRNRFGQAGRARVEKLFSLRRQTRLLEELYDQVINEKMAT